MAGERRPYDSARLFRWLVICYNTHRGRLVSTIVCISVLLSRFLTRLQF